MIRILIMDDNEDKICVLRDMLIKECFINGDSIATARNIHEGRIALSDKLFDLLILDMVIPAKSDTDALASEGVNFINEIYDNPALKCPSQIIGLTQFDDGFEDLKRKFENKLWYLIKYKQNDIEWKNLIKNKVFHLIRNEEEIEKSIFNRDRYDIGIICALQEEFRCMKESFDEEWHCKRISGFPLDVYETVVVNAYGEEIKICAACLNRAGMVATCAIAVSMYDIMKVEKIFMTGYAAGIKYGELKLGDIVISKSIQDYSVGKLIDLPCSEYRLLKELSMLTADESLLFQASSLSADFGKITDLNLWMYGKTALETNVKAYVSPSVCGPFVVASANAIDEIRKADRKFSALDMEGFGLYYAGHLLGKKCLWIKGISDMADSKKDDSYHVRSALASGRFLYILIKEYVRL